MPLTRCGTNREYYISRIRREKYLPNANNLANFVVGRKTNYSLIVCRFFVFIKVIANKQKKVCMLGCKLYESSYYLTVCYRD